VAVKINHMIKQRPVKTGDKAGVDIQTDVANAFEALFRNHWNRVCNIVYRLVGDPDEAEDLALEAFWRLYGHYRSGEIQENTGGWLYRVATNLGYNALRARKRRRAYEEEAAKELIVSNAGENTAAEVDSREEQERVRWVLGKIKPRSAQILLLKYSGFSYSEIASAVDVAPSSVGALLVRAEKEFEKKYRELEGRQP